MFETIEQEETYTNLERDIAVHDLENALGNIPAHYRNILLLYYREGFSYEELTNILMLPINTVKTHLRRARQALAKILKETYG